MRSTRFRLHVGIEGEREEGGRDGEKGVEVEGGKVAVSVVGRVERVSAGAIAFPWGGNSPQARDKVSSHLQNTSYTTTTTTLPSLSPSAGSAIIVARRDLVIKYFLDNGVAASRFFIRGPRGDNEHECLLLFKLR